MGGHRHRNIASACFLIVVFMVIAVIGLRVQTAKVPKFLGNRAENFTYVNTTSDPNDFTFIALGDIKGGMATFKELLDIARADKPAFVVILGDFVCDPEPIRHQLFALKMKEENLPFPVFVVPGNHDVSPDGPFRLKDFEKTYGPAQFHFTIGKYFFVFLNNIPAYSKTGEYLRFLEQAVSEQAGKNREVFVFMHVPPPELSPSIKCSGLHGSKHFLQLARKYNIRYVFTGDHHGYIKIVKDGTTYIVTGGGGARLRGEHGRFYHLFRVAVEKRMITETVIATKKRLETIELLQRNIVFYLWPLIGKNFISAGVTLLLFGMVIWLLIRPVRNKKRTSSPDNKS